MTGLEDWPGVRISVTVNDTGYVEHHVSPDTDTMPAAMLVLYLNPMMPNAMLEYESVTQVFQPEFLTLLREQIEAYGSEIEMTDEEREQHVRDVAFVLMMNGLDDGVQTLNDDEREGA